MVDDLVEELDLVGRGTLALEEFVHRGLRRFTVETDQGRQEEVEAFGRVLGLEEEVFEIDQVLIRQRRVVAHLLHHWVFALLADIVPRLGTVDGAGPRGRWAIRCIKQVHGAA